MVSGSLALLFFLLGFHGGRQGSGPNKGQSPVEWGDFLFVHLFIRQPVPPLAQPAGPEAQPDMPEAGGLAGWLAGPQIWLAGPQIWLAGPRAWLAGHQAWLDGPEGRTDGWTNVQKISPFYRTLSPIGATAQKLHNFDSA